jgi:hypothetical protein
LCTYAYVLFDACVIKKFRKKNKVIIGISGKNLGEKIFWNFCQKKYFWRSLIIAPPPLSKQGICCPGGQLSGNFRYYLGFIFLHKKNLFIRV